MLGKAIKELNLPRDEIVVLTKVFFIIKIEVSKKLINPQVFFAVGKTPSTATLYLEDKDRAGYTNQYGLSRKVS
jgi:aryl-alcohol dehydrogenase-like predicted oxidoreductase